MAVRRCGDPHRADRGVAVVRFHRRADTARAALVVGPAVPALPGRRRGDVADRDARPFSRHAARRKVRSNAEAPDREARPGMAAPGVCPGGRPARVGRGFFRDRRPRDPRHRRLSWPVAAGPVQQHVRAWIPNPGLPQRRRRARGPGFPQPRAARPRAIPGGQAHAGPARPMRRPAAVRGADAGAVRGRLRTLADRREPCLDRATSTTRCSEWRTRGSPATTCSRRRCCAHSGYGSSAR